MGLKSRPLLEGLLAFCREVGRRPAVLQVAARLNRNFELMAYAFQRQCHAIAVMRLRRGLQMADLYGRLYNISSLKHIIDLFKLGCTSGTRNRKLMTLLCSSVFALEKQKITDDEMTSTGDEINYVRDFIDGKSVPDNIETVNSSWEVCIDTPSLKVWRQPLKNTHLYEYKVYGSYKDIPARAFYDVQVDLPYRRSWDRLVIKLEVVDRDPTSGNEVVQWITHYPYPMYSREYLYLRKYKVDQQNKLMVMMARGVNHPRFPVDQRYVRVVTYQSHMVIRPHKSFDENGFDYLLSYYDDPQASIPGPAMRWMARKGVPDFVNTLHNAAKIRYENKLNGHFDESDPSSSDRITL